MKSLSVVTLISMLINQMILKPIEKFMDIPSQFNLVQHKNEPTHKLGNTLDLIITKRTFILLNHKVDFQISDNNNILFQIDMRKPACPQKVVKVEES